MSRRNAPREYFEEEESEYERERDRARDRYPRSRRREREFDENVEYRRRRSMPPVEDLERLRIREQAPQDLVRESFAPPRKRGPVALRRSREEVDEDLSEQEMDVYMRPRPRRRSRRPSDFDEEELVVDKREIHGGGWYRPREIDEEELVLDRREVREGRRHRPRNYDEEERIIDEREAKGGRRRRPRDVEKEELIIDEKDVRGGRRRRPIREVDEEELIFDRRQVREGRRSRPREIDEEELMIDERKQEPHGRRRNRPEPSFGEDEIIVRRKDKTPQRPYESEGDLRLRGRHHEDTRDEVYYRSSESRRRPRRREAYLEEVMIDDRDDRRRNGRDRGLLRSKEEEIVMQWKDRPTPDEPDEETDELQVRETRRHGRRVPEFVGEPPGGFPPNRHDEETEELHVRSRMRSRPRHPEAEENEEEIVIRKDNRNRDHRRGSTDSDELVVRRSRRRSSPKGHSSSPEPIRAPPIHQDVITHHRHIDHGFENTRQPRASSHKIPSTRTSFDEVEICQRTSKGGRKSEEDVVFEHRDEEESVSPTSGPSIDFHNPWSRKEDIINHHRRSVDDERDSVVAKISHRRGHDLAREIDLDEKISIHEMRPGDDIKHTTDKWSVIHAPSKTEAVEMTGALDIVEVAPKESSEDEVEVIEEEHRGRVGPQVSKERRNERWTEITKDLVVREAIERLGYEFEETRMFYYIFSYLEPGDIDELVELSDEIREARRRRIREMHRERTSLPPQRRMSLVDRLPPRHHLGGERRMREREWLIDIPRR